MNILSVEELAAVNDTVISKLGMGAREMREQARAFIDAARSGAGNAMLAAENGRLREEMEALKAQFAAFMAQPPIGQHPLSGSVGQPIIDPDGDGPEEGKPIEDCTDGELKAYIKKQTGKPVLGNPSRETLLARAEAIATGADPEGDA